MHKLQFFYTTLLCKIQIPILLSISFKLNPTKRDAADIKIKTKLKNQSNL